MSWPPSWRSGFAGALHVVLILTLVMLKSHPYINFKLQNLTQLITLTQTPLGDITLAITRSYVYARCLAFWTGFQDFGERWRSVYEMEDLASVCEDLWQQVKPLYQQIHAYIRRKLMDIYSKNSKDFPSTRQIPDHILGKSSHLKSQSIDLSAYLMINLPATKGGTQSPFWCHTLCFWSRIFDVLGSCWVSICSHLEV